MKHRWLAMAGALLLLLCTALTVYGAEASGTEKRVLFISSYSYDWPSVPLEIQGFKGGLNDKADIQYLFMNTKNLDTATASDLLKKNLDSLDAHYRYDLVVLADDAALDFALAQRDTTFKDIPLVFLGINTESRARQAAQDPTVTGLAETLPIADTIESAAAIQPQATRVVAITDGTLTGQGTLDQFKAAMAGFPKLKSEILDSSRLTPDQIRTQVAGYNDDTILLFLNLTTDGSGRIYTFEEGLHLITDSAGSPVYKADEIGLGMGLLGGCVISYQEMGDLAGQMARQILDGKNPSDIPVKVMSTRYAFDKKVMDRYGVKTSSLPAGATLINAPPDFLATYGKVILPAGVILALLCVIIVLLLHDRRRRTKMTAQLAESETVLAIAMEQAGTQMAAYYPDTRRAVFAPQAQANFGFSETMTDYPDSVFADGAVHPGDQAAYRSAIRHMDAGGASASIDYRIRYTDAAKSYQWERLNLTRLQQPKGQPAKVVMTSTNIETYKQAEREYAQQAEYLKSLSDVRLVGKGQYNLTRDRVDYYWDKGITPEEDWTAAAYSQWLGRLAGYALLAEDRQHIQDSFSAQGLLKALAEGRNTVELAYPVDAGPGIRPWLSVRYQTFVEPVTRDIITFAYSYDITLEVQARHIVERLVAVGYDFLALIDIKNRRFTLHAINQAESGLAEGLELGVPYPLEELAEMTTRRISGSERARIAEANALSTILAQLEAAPSYTSQFTLLQGDELRRKSVLYSYLDGQRDCLLCCRSDITAMYRQNQLQLDLVDKARKAAEKASLAKTDFLARMSHDIRTPMNTIIGMTHLAMDETGDPAAIKGDLKKIQSAGEFLLGLINDILDMSTIENGGFTLHPAPYPYSDFLKTLTAMFDPLCRDKAITLTLEPGKEDPILLVDRVRFNQIFFNLLSNAVKFTPEGGHILFRNRSRLTGAGTLACDFTVADTGCGMGPEFMERLFTPFTQEDTAITAQGQGSGLGLSIAHSIVTQMGGTLTAESALGAGTTMTVGLELPLVQGAAPARPDAMGAQPAQALSPATASQGAAPPPDSDTLAGRHILLAEDQPLNVEIARRLLAKAGVSVDVAGDGAQAVAAFRDSAPGTYDAILMDIRMPVMTGLAAARAIRALPRPDAGAIPIVALTANAFSSDVQDSLDSGMDAHLGKPIEPLLLYQTLAEVMAKKG